MARPEFGVGAALADELLVCAVFYNAAVFQHQKSIELRNGAEAVRDGDDGFVLHQRVQIFLNGMLDLAIQRGGSFIHNKDWCVFEDEACDGDTLALATGEFDPAFSYLAGVAGVAVLIGQREDEIVRVGHFGGGDDLLFGSIRAAIGDVGADGAVEQGGILRDHADVAAEAVLRDFRDVLVIDGDGAIGEFVEAQQQVDQCAFARAGVADEADLLACRDGEVEVFDDRIGLRVIAEGNVVKADLPAFYVQRFGLLGIGECVRLDEHLHGFFGGAQLLEECGEFAGYPARLIGEHDRDGDDHGDRTCGDEAVRPEPERQGEGCTHEDGVVEV